MTGATPAELTDTDVRLAELLATWADDAVARGPRERAFEELVGLLMPRVYAVCRRELGSNHDAEEATQDTLVKVARSAHSFRGDSKVSTWVYRIAINACRDLQRKLARRPQTPVGDLEQVVRHDPTVDVVADRVEGVAELDRLERAMAALDDDARTLLVLCAIEGLSYPEASEVLDMPVGTIKSKVFRARARLAELLAADGQAES